MISLKVMSAAAVLALALPALTPTESFAQSPFHRGPGGLAAGAPRAAGAGGPRFNAGGPHLGAGGPRFNNGGGHFAGGGGYRNGGGGGGGFIPGAIAGAVIGGAVAASQGPYYNSYGYYNDGPSYAGTPYYSAPYDDGTTVVEAAPQGDDDAVAYCMQRYRSYDPGSGTFLGNDGMRHPCP
jgi:BA14K-like protein